MGERSLTSTAQTVAVPDDFKTALMIGSSADFEVRLDGKPLGTAKGTGAKVQPDQSSFEVVLSKGKHTIAIVTKGNAVVFARLADPDRKLRYPEVTDKK